MTKNILSLNDFKGKKSPIQEDAIINEMVESIDDVYRVSVDVDLPKSLVSSFIKKVKESTGKDLRADMGEKRLAERLVQWANENYLNIENLPVEIVTGSDKSPVQGQVQGQAQSQVQPIEDETQAQTQTQAQPANVQAQPSQPVQNTQAQKPSVQVQGNAQNAAAQIPAQEI